MLFTKEVTPYYTGWDTFFLCYGEDENGVWGADVLCYQTHEDRGVGSCSYDLISYAGGRERYLDGNTITFVLEADGAAPVPDIRPCDAGGICALPRGGGVAAGGKFLSALLQRSCRGPRHTAGS